MKSVRFVIMTRVEKRKQSVAKYWFGGNGGSRKTIGEARDAAVECKKNNPANFPIWIERVTTTREIVG